MNLIFVLSLLIKELLKMVFQCLFSIVQQSLYYTYEPTSAVSRNSETQQTRVRDNLNSIVLVAGERWPNEIFSRVIRIPRDEFNDS